MRHTTSRTDEGISSTRLDAIDAYFAKKVDEGAFPGIVVLVARHGKIVHLSATGNADIAKKQKLRTDTIFRIYSMTKPVAATALMTLYEEGQFQMNDPLSKFIPEFSNLRVLRTPDAYNEDTVEPLHPPTVEDALRHTTGFTHAGEPDAYGSLYTNAEYFGLDTSLKNMMTILSKIPLKYQPGTRWAYSISPDIQARLVEILSGKAFDVYLNERIFAPLGMTDTSFWLPPDKADRLATVYWAHNGELMPIDDDHNPARVMGPYVSHLLQPQSVNSYTVNHVRKVASFGLASTAEDYFRFAQMLLNGGSFGGEQILSPPIVRYMLSDHLQGIDRQQLSIGHKGCSFGLGFGIVVDAAASGAVDSDGSFFWNGAAGTVWWADPKENLIVVGMTQSYAPGVSVSTLPAQLRSMVYGAFLGQS